ncbi:ADP-ribosylglycohydrolase family protein [Candidatus Saccharibacteria bacterium]|nr:ADP-ribosylglycohydrolase family protein [Candidatus Saccharibacteria bacterium]
MSTDKYTKIDKSRACLILGALGDALGAPVEFMKYDEIVSKYGDTPNTIKGIQMLDDAYGKKGAITDDTQMTLFAADGLISAFKRGAERGILGEYWGYTAISYVKWLETQGQENPNYSDFDWGSHELFEVVKKQGQRGPGNTCLGSLRAMQKPAELAKNDSKGCGTVMRVAPIGIFFGNLIKDTSKQELQKVYDEGVHDAAITHGHQTAQHASGILAVIVALVLHGEPLEKAIRIALDDFGTQDVSELCEKAVQLASEPPSVENLQKLGEGWVAEEALAIAIYCSLLGSKKVLSVEDSLRLAVNHDGDSDSTGAITGNLLGIEFGTKVIPQSLIGTDTEVSSLVELLRRYGEDLIEIADYKQS